MARNHEDLWDDDFDEADIEASILKASQMCPNLLDPLIPPSTAKTVLKHNSMSQLPMSSVKSLAQSHNPFGRKPGPSITASGNKLRIDGASVVSIKSQNKAAGTSHVIAQKAKGDANFSTNIGNEACSVTETKLQKSLDSSARTSKKVIDEIEQMEIDALMEDPNVWDDSTFLDDPNIFDVESPEISSPTSQDQASPKNEDSSKIDDELNSNKFLDSFDGIDPDLLSSQPIPGTQPRQRWQNQNKLSKHPDKSAPSKYPVVNTNHKINTVSVSSTNEFKFSSSNLNTDSSNALMPSSKFARSAHGDRICASVFNSSPTSPSKGSQAIKCGQSIKNSSMMPPAPTSGCQALQMKPPATSTKSLHQTLVLNASQRTNTIKQQPEIVSNDSIRSQSNNFLKPMKFKQGQSNVLDHLGSQVSGIQTIKNGNCHNSTDAHLNLASMEELVANLQKEIMTKRGEVSWLRSELQRKSLALDAERMARMGADESHKKDLSDKVAAATLEGQAKYRALEKRLEKFHGELAFKSREIMELTTKCKRLEQGQMQQQKRHQQQMQMYSEMVDNHEHQHSAAEASESPAKFRAPLPPQSCAPAASKSSLDEPRRFPRSRFDFSKDAPNAASRVLQSVSPSKASSGTSEECLLGVQNNSSISSLPKPQLPSTSSVLSKKPEKKKLLIENEVHVAPVYRRMGFYKSSLESLSMLSSLSATSFSPTTARETSCSSTGDFTTFDIRDQLAKTLTISHQTTSQNVIFSKQHELVYTSIALNQADENADAFCERDMEGNYKDTFDYTDFINSVEIKPATVKKEKLLKKGPRCAAFKHEDDNKKDKVVDYDSISQERATFKDLYQVTNSRRKEIESGGLCSEDCPSVCQWTDKDVESRTEGQNIAHVKVSEKMMRPYTWSIKRALKVKQSHNEKSFTKVVEFSITDIQAMPQEWMRLLSAMSQDSAIRKFENALEEDLPETGEGNSSVRAMAETENDTIGLNIMDKKRVGASETLLKQKRERMKKKLGNFLYDLTHEILENNIGDLDSGKTENENKDSSKDPSNSKSKQSEVCAMDVDYAEDPTKENFNHKTLLLLCQPPAKSKKGASEQYNASRELFHCVLEWLAQEAAYYRNVEKKSAIMRDEFTAQQHLQVMTSALVILRHLLPLRFSCDHLPAPITILTFLLYPLDVTIKMALKTSSLLLQCVQQSASERDAVMVPELAQLLVERLCRACHCAATYRQLTALMRCLAALSAHRAFVQALCKMTDDCFVWRLCLRFLDFCDVVLPNAPRNPNAEGDDRKNNVRLQTVRDVVALTKNLDSAASYYALRNLVGESQDLASPDVRDCVRSFYRFVISVLLAKPNWLFSDCLCNIVLLATLLVVLHSQVNALVQGLPSIYEMKQVYCSYHQLVDSNDSEHKLNSAATTPTQTNTQSNTSMKKTTPNAKDRSILSLVHFEPSSIFGGDSKTLNNVSTTNISSNNNTQKCQPAADPGSASTLQRSLTCSLCNSTTQCSGQCHCLGACASVFDSSIFDVHASCGCDCSSVVSGLRALKLYLATDPHCAPQTAGIPSYTLLIKLITSALPFFAPLIQSDAGKLLARMS